ncbi:DUF998 domain-containing protein [Dactylosporangium sp. CA-233914]|uniref:DUF998 domain-containing protein n=1 Tax=Dactylosporangium sp. CA-233914 TaxID=3239934 RepID=UPI003D94CD2F
MSATRTLIAAATPARPPHRPNRLLRAGLLAGPLFVAALLVEQAFRDGYDPMRHPVSSLALGPTGWTQIVNFLVAGVLCLAFAVGLRRALRPGPGAAAAPLLLAVWAVGLLGAGVFSTDPVGGYPAGTPLAPAPPTWHGRLHDVAFSLPGFVALIAAMFVLAYAYARRRTRIWSAYSALSGIATLTLFTLTTIGFAQVGPFAATAGLLQRLTVTVGWLWLALIAARETRADRSPQRP